MKKSNTLTALVLGLAALIVPAAHAQQAEGAAAPQAVFKMYGPMKVVIHFADEFTYGGTGPTFTYADRGASGEDKAGAYVYARGEKEDYLELETITPGSVQLKLKGFDEYSTVVAQATLAKLDKRFEKELVGKQNGMKLSDALAKFLWAQLQSLKQIENAQVEQELEEQNERAAEAARRAEALRQLEKRLNDGVLKGIKNKPFGK